MFAPSNLSTKGLLLHVGIITHSMCLLSSVTFCVALVHNTSRKGYKLPDQTVPWCTVLNTLPKINISKDFKNHYQVLMLLNKGYITKLQKLSILKLTSIFLTEKERATEKKPTLALDFTWVNSNEWEHLQLRMPCP